MSAADKAVNVPVSVIEAWKHEVNNLAAMTLKSERYGLGAQLKQDMADVLAEAEKAQPAPELSMLPSGNVLLRCADCVAYDPDATCRVCRLFVPKGRADAQPAEMLEILEECRSSVVFDRTRYSQLVLSGSTHTIKTAAADECGRLGVLLDRIDAAMLAARAEKGGT